MDFLRALAEIRSPFWDTVVGALTYLGSETVIIIAVCLIFWCINKKLAYGVGFAYFLSGIAIHCGKIGFRIERPWVRDPSFTAVESAKAGAGGYSFPSGHTQSATALYGTLAVLVRKGWAKLLFFLFIPLVAFTRMYLGVHTPADVAVGFGVAALIVLVVALIYRTDNMKLKTYGVLGSLIVLAAAAALCFAFELQSRGLIDYKNTADTCKMAGAAVGFALGAVIESGFIRFGTRTARLWQQAVKLALGVAGLMGVRLGLKAAFAAINEQSLVFDALRYFLMVFWIIVLWPLIFKALFKAPEKAAAVGQHEITTPGPLLDKKGRLTEPGYARSLILDYDRKAIKAAGYRIKEWDYYYIGNARFGVALTIDDNSYMALDSISLLNFDEGWEITNSPMRAFTGGRTGLPSSSVAGDIASGGKHYSISFRNEGERRILTFRLDNFRDGKPIEGEITLACPPTDSMVIVTPFEGDKQAFYYNQKINCMPASGCVSFDGCEYRFEPSDSFGVLDWGRGVWTYKNTWYWGSASGLCDGVPFGFNIGYGFGDTSAASENMLFYNHKAHKLSQVRFNIPVKDGKDDFMSPWTFTSDDGRFELNFTPVLDRASKTDVGLICSDQHQVFGRFDGHVTLDDGTVLTVTDLPGFAEKVRNKW